MSISVSKSITVAAAPDEVVRVAAELEDPSRWAQEVTSARVLERDEQGRPVRVKVTLAAFGLSSTATYAVEHRKREIVLRLTRSKLVRTNELRYSVADDGSGGTRLTMDVDLQLRIVAPGFVVRRMIERDMAGNLKALKRSAEALAPAGR